MKGERAEMCLLSGPRWTTLSLCTMSEPCLHCRPALRFACTVPFSYHGHGPPGPGCGLPAWIVLATIALSP